MCRLSYKLGVAALTFSFGIFASTGWSRLYLNAPRSETTSVSWPREEQWHRLYEAAGMSGDWQLRQEVDNMLICANRSGVSDAWPVAHDGTLWCRRRDGSEHQVNAITGEYGAFLLRVREGHTAWTLQNMEFVRSISSPEKARGYVVSHREMLRP